MDWLKPHFQPLDHTVTTFFVSPQVLTYSLWCGRKVLFLITLHGEQKLATRTQTFCGAKKFGIVAAEAAAPFRSEALNQASAMDYFAAFVSKV